MAAYSKCMLFIHFSTTGLYKEIATCSMHIADLELLHTRFLFSEIMTKINENNSK